MEKKKISINELKDKAAKISDEKFGRENPVTVPVLKMVEEIGELLDALNNQLDPDIEFADCFLLLIDAYRKYYGDDVDMQTLINTSSEKLDIVAKREWGKPNEDGVYKHIEEPQEEKSEDSTNEETKRWLAYQQIVVKQEGSNITIDTIIRSIDAKTIEEAMGKFILHTNTIEAVKKLEPFCFPLNDLKKLD